jgi:hypothetical protein
VAGLKGGFHVLITSGPIDTSGNTPPFNKEPLKVSDHEAYVSCVTIQDSRIYAAGMDGILTAHELIFSHDLPILRREFRRKVHDNGQLSVVPLLHPSLFD